MSKDRSQAIRTCARRKLGLEQLRDGQQEAIQALLDGRDTVVVQPTGSGKSAIYQIAGLLLPGATLIVSPLLALQRDQIDSIATQPHGKAAAAINSTLSAASTREVFEALRGGKLEFIFLAPEQLRNPEVIDALREANLSLFVVDEAHCISEWGHDFRPDYLRLGEVIRELGHPVTLALTATASREVRREIVERLRMRKPKVLVSGFDRPEIRLRVDRFTDEGAKLSSLVHHVRWAEKPGIVYVATRRNAEMVMRALSDEGVDAEYYHAGLRSGSREAIQDRFMNGETPVIVATSAFGMGIDKGDVRFVYHYDMPESLDSYYQEVGRAGRDGLPAEAILFYRPQNAGIRKFQAGTGRIDPPDIEKVLAALEGNVGTPESIAEATGLPSYKVDTILDELSASGAIAARAGRWRLRKGVDRDKVGGELAAHRDLVQRRRKERVQQVQSYATISSCRREFLLRYFDDEWGACVNCDNCTAAAGHILPAELSGGTRREVAGG
jgi:ATP-dependent DNA helicase RecQ